MLGEKVPFRTILKYYALAAKMCVLAVVKLPTVLTRACKDERSR